MPSMTVSEVIEYLKTQRQDAIVRIPDLDEDNKIRMKELHTDLIYLWYKDGSKREPILDLGDC